MTARRPAGGAQEHAADAAPARPTCVLFFIYRETQLNGANTKRERVSDCTAGATRKTRNPGGRALEALSFFFCTVQFSFTVTARTLNATAQSRATSIAAVRELNSGLWVKREPRYPSKRQPDILQEKSKPVIPANPSKKRRFSFAQAHGHGARRPAAQGHARHLGARDARQPRVLRNLRLPARAPGGWAKTHTSCPRVLVSSCPQTHAHEEQGFGGTQQPPPSPPFPARRMMVICSPLSDFWHCGAHTAK